MQLMFGHKVRRLPATLATVGLALGLSACQTVGQGPVELSPQTAEHLARYMEVRGVKEFAISEDGYFSSYAYCPDLYNCDAKPNVVLRGCESLIAKETGTEGKCWLFARNNEIVWQGPVTFPEGY